MADANRVLRSPAMWVMLHSFNSWTRDHEFTSWMNAASENISVSGLEFGVWDLIVGSYEDRALTKAVETCFPLATTLLCRRHLEENVRRRLQDKVGVPAEVRQDIVRHALRDLQAGTSGRLLTLPGAFWMPPDAFYCMTGQGCAPVIYLTVKYVNI